MSRLPDKSNRGVEGFTLIEALVALTLLAVGLVPAFGLATNALILSTTVRDNMIAANLAQEGVEVVRAVRDANWLGGNPFDTNLTGCGTGCTVQFDGDTPVVASFVAAPLLLDPLTGLYQYNTGAPTLFYRTITITAETPYHLKVLSTVTWRERQVDKTFTLEYHLYDWLQ